MTLFIVCSDFIELCYKEQCNQLFDKSKQTEWVEITDANLCFGKAEGGIDACQVKQFACQVY